MEFIVFQPFLNIINNAHTVEMVALIYCIVKQYTNNRLLSNMLTFNIYEIIFANRILYSISE